MPDLTKVLDRLRSNMGAPVTLSVRQAEAVLAHIDTLEARYTEVSREKLEQSDRLHEKIAHLCEAVGDGNCDCVDGVMTKGEHHELHCKSLQ